MKKNKKFTVAALTLLLTPTLLVGCGDNKKADTSDKDAVNKYKTELANKYEKEANESLTKGKITEASVYYNLAEDEGKTSNSLQDDLSAWKKATDFETVGNYKEALNKFKAIPKTSNKGFNRILDLKISDLTTVVGNINKYNKGYQQAETSYKGKNYPEAIKQLNALLQDPAIKNKEYTEIFANVNKLLVTATEAQYKISSQNTQSQNNTQQSTPPKLTNGKQVTQQDIVKARQQIDQLNVDGIKAQNCSDPDVVNVINAALKNHNSKDLTAKDIKDGLHLK